MISGQSRRQCFTCTLHKMFSAAPVITLDSFQKVDARVKKDCYLYYYSREGKLTQGAFFY